MTIAIDPARTYAGPAILRGGFRLLFLAAGVWAAVAMALWIGMLSGALMLPTAFGVVDWHVHELLYAYLPAVLAGFLLTAVPNWTGRLPIAGGRLIVLALCWLAGRLAVLASAEVGTEIAAFIDLTFLAMLGFLVGREIIVGRNWRNLKVLAIVVLLLGGNVAFHLEAVSNGIAWNGHGARVGVAAAVALIMLIGGRVVPSFTRNWLARRESGRLPTPPGWFDVGVVCVAIAALAVWVAFPLRPETAALCVLAGGLHAWRLARWAGQRTLAEPIVLVLHLGYAFVPIGFLLVGLAILQPDVLAPSAALHAWTAGAIGGMTLAMMTRAGLGHTGHPLHATPAITAIYACVLLSAIARIFAGFGLAPLAFLYLAAAAWFAAFTGFAIRFAPIFVKGRI